MPASAFLLSVSAAARAASLNLCSDEYLLLLAKPGEAVSVSYLAHDRRESALWRRAASVPANRGSIEDVIARRPTVVLTMGGGGRATGRIGRRLGTRVVDLPPPTSIGDVERNLMRVAATLGEPGRAVPWIRRLRALRQHAPASTVDSLWLSHGGLSLGPGSLGSQWLALAGYRQRPVPGGQVNLETFVTYKPKLLIISDYRSGQISRGQRWLDHPLVKNAGTKRITTDGRPWTCLGPAMIAEVERLRRSRPQ